MLCEFFSVLLGPHTPLTGHSPRSYLSDEFPLLLSLKQSPSPFFLTRQYFVIRQETSLSYDNSSPRSSKCQDNHSLFIPLLRQAHLCQRAVWQGMFPCWTCPALPRLWYCCGLPSCRARLPVIGLPFSSHHLSALWIQLQGPKRTTTLQLKRLICLSPISSASFPCTACYVFINSHLLLFL